MDKVVNQRELGSDDITRYQDDGFLIIPGLITASALPGLRDEVYAILQAETGLSRSELATARSFGERLRQSQAYLRGSLIDKLINGEEMIALASQLIGGPAVRYNPFTAYKGRGGGAFDFHQDNNYTAHQPALGSINIWVALVNMSPENGCLRMVPGSHKAGTLDSVDAGDQKHQKLAFEVIDDRPIEVSAGDAVAFTRLTVHGSGPNTTDKPRLAYALQYHREDVHFFDEDAALWRRLIDVPRFQTPPLDHLPAQQA